jgi:hypothetical protein
MTSLGFPPSLAESLNPVLPLISFSDTTLQCVRSRAVLGARDRADQQQLRPNHEPGKRAALGAVRCPSDVVMEWS